MVYQWLTYCGLGLGLLTLAGCPFINDLLDGPEAAFEAAPVTGEAPLTVLFEDASISGTANITAWEWDFGDGTSVTTRNPTHIYESPGQYTVSLTVTSDVGTDTELKREYINVVEPPAAAFAAMPEAGSVPLEVAFEDTTAPGSAPITNWLWNFGDRSPTSSEQNPVHTYTAPGLYTVSLTVTTEAGEDTMTRTAFINVADGPVADFSADFTPGVAPLTVAFRDESETGTAIIEAWTWDFGDGNMSTEQHPRHTYMEPGVYTVSLEIETSSGADRVERADFIVVDEGPTAAFTGEPLMGPAPLTVAFTDTSEPGSQAITRYLWDFGDGGLLSTRANPTRTYTEPGTYTVSLRVTTDAGSNTLEEADFITVVPGVSFSANQTEGRGSLTVQFVDESAVGDLAVSARAWDFGDGGMSTARNPEHTYTEPGVYDVSLEIETDLGPSMDTRAGFIVVAPDTAFTAEPASGPPPLEVAFTDTTEAGALEIEAWAWDFGDGAKSDEQNPMHIYETPGAYTVSLAATTEIGTTTEKQAALVEVAPVVDFSAGQQAGQGTLTVNFQDESDAGNLNILGWLWDFGDGTTSTDQNPSHTYDEIASYDVSLTLTTALGEETAAKEAFIQVQPVVDFRAEPVTGEGALSVTFTDLTDPGTLEIEAWAWEFGDGMVSDEQNPVHAYQPGEYSVTLTVTTAQGDTATTKEDLILSAPEVLLDFVQQSGATPFEASLLDVSVTGTFEVLGWHWDLGDGNTSDEQNPVHTYEEPGTYTVTLTLMTDGGDFSKTVPNFVTALRGPTADFTFTRSPDPSDPVIVQFEDLSLPGDADKILNWTWEFGESAIAADGEEEEQNPEVEYPREAFESIPQDVSLTVRTMIAEDTLLREDLFGEEVMDKTLSPEALDATAFHALAAGPGGEVWGAGRLDTSDEEAPVLVRWSAAGTQRWGAQLELDGGLAINGLAVAADGDVLVAGTWNPDGEARVFIGRFDRQGKARWETAHGQSGLCYGAGITERADGSIAVTGYAPVAPGGEYSLFLLTGGADGRGITRHEMGLPVTPAPIPLSSGSNGLVAGGLDANGEGFYTHLPLDGRAGTAQGLAGMPHALYEHAESDTLYLARDVEEGCEVVAVREGVEPVLVRALPAGTPVAFTERDGTVEAVWIERDGDTGEWVIHRQPLSL